MKNNRGLAIVRVSTTEQAHEERYSIPHQRVHIQEECRKRGIDLVHFCEFVQSGAKVLSSSSKERAEVLHHIRDYGVNVVVVHELDRLARSMLDTLLFVADLDKLGVSFVSIHDGFDTTTPQGQLQMHILSAFSEYFRKQLASKVMGGMVERAKQGKHMGRRPLGYQIGPSGFTADEEESKIIQLIFSWYLDQNLGLRGVADQLNSMGVKSLRGNVWSHVSVREIIENEVYTGVFVWGEIRVEGNHPAIIERATWEKAQARRRRKKELGGRAQNSIFLLSGLARCGCCGEATMVGRTARKGKYIYRYYTCNNYASKGTQVCSSGYVRADKVEKDVLAKVEEFSRAGLTVKQDLVPAEITLIKEQVELNKKEFVVLNAQLIRAAEAYERGAYDLEWYMNRKRKIEAEMSDMTKEIAALEKRARGHLPQKEIARRINEKKKIAKEILKERDTIKAKARLQEIIDRVEIMSENEINVYIRV